MECHALTANHTADRPLVQGRLGRSGSSSDATQVATCSLYPPGNTVFRRHWFSIDEETDGDEETARRWTTAPVT
jgi:hypothetical protein